MKIDIFIVTIIGDCGFPEPHTYTNQKDAEGFFLEMARARGYCDSDASIGAIKEWQGQSGFHENIISWTEASVDVVESEGRGCFAAIGRIPDEENEIVILNSATEEEACDALEKQCCDGEDPPEGGIIVEAILRSDSPITWGSSGGFC